jgi:hypothetical protein
MKKLITGRTLGTVPFDVSPHTDVAIGCVRRFE